MYPILVITLVLTGLCISKSTPNSSTGPALVYQPQTCGTCEVRVATASASPASSTLNSDISTAIVFTAYSITSAYSLSGLCVTTSGSRIPVSPPYSVPIPASVPASNFIYNAGNSFVDYLGISCDNGASQNVITLVDNNGSIATSLPPSVTASRTEASISRNSTETTSSIPNRNLDEQAKIGIGITVPVVVTSLVLLALLFWRRSRRIKERNAVTGHRTPPEDMQPYLQQKAELEAEEKRKHELALNERRYELNGETTIHEISDGNGDGFPTSHVRQELGGEEHSRELEVP